MVSIALGLIGLIIIFTLFLGMLGMLLASRLSQKYQHRPVRWSDFWTEDKNL